MATELCICPLSYHVVPVSWARDRRYTPKGLTKIPVIQCNPRGGEEAIWPSLCLLSACWSPTEGLLFLTWSSFQTSLIRLQCAARQCGSPSCGCWNPPSPTFGKSILHSSPAFQSISAPRDPQTHHQSSWEILLLGNGLRGDGRQRLPPHGLA